jgi:hypothetical protein
VAQTQISYAQVAVLAQNVNFRARVKAAMVTAAQTISAEAVAANGQGPLTYQARHQLATQVINGADPYLDRFAWAAASYGPGVNTVVTDSLHDPVSIVKTYAVNPAVIACGSAHGLVSGDVAEIDGALDSTLDGTWVVTVKDAQQFSVPVLGGRDEQAAPGGTVTKQAPDSDLAAAVSSAWNAIAGVGVPTQ